MDNQYNYYNPNENYQYGGGFSDGQDHNTSGSGGGKRPRKGVPRAVVVTGFAILFGVVASAVFLASNVIGSRLLGLGGAAESSETTSGQVNNGSTLSRSSSVVTSDVSDVVEEVMPSLVSITSMSVEEVQNFFGQSYERTSQGAGTGIIIGENESELMIVTNDHVVSGSDTLTVTFSDQTSVEADIKGTDSNYDVAVIAVQMSAIPDSTRNEIKVATLGDSTALKVGEPAIAIGNALGYGQSVTTGVISALNRQVTTTNSETGEVQSSGVELIQTDAAINGGNSGGALVNVNGEVVGINSSKQVGDTVEGIGYAIPISDVSELIQSLMNQETKTRVSEEDRGMIGITGISVSDAFSQEIDMPAGVYVTEITAGGGAEEAGMTRGCIITGINGSTVDSMEALQQQLEYYAKGETVTLTIQVPQTNGEYKEQTIDVTLK